jgi:tryptophan halogenase
MATPGEVRSILIVGGGTSGWMAAAYLQHFLRRTDCSITLVESDQIGTIGVGEATIPRIVSFVRNMGFPEDDFMRACHATYKLGIRFHGWSQKEEAYWHPFGVCGGSIDGIDLFHFWLQSAQAERGEGPLSSYSLQAQLAESFKAPRSIRGSSPVMKSGAYAFHVDSTSLAAYLKGIAIAGGVEHVVDEIRDVRVNPRRFIDSVETEGGRTLSADLYLDCTGFRGRLIEQALGDPWIDWSGTLLCDRAVVRPLALDATMHPYTQATAGSAGWRWQIPLSHRIGAGYVYSSAHIDDDAAQQELVRGVPPGQILEDPRFLDMRVGRRESFWIGNCVSVGLASGFVEPLESTGLFFIQIAVELLMEYFPERSCHESLARAYNGYMASVYEETRDFILLHYLLSGGEDTPFWRDSRAVSVPDTLQDLLALYDEVGNIRRGLSPFPPTSYHFILAGNGRLPRRPSPQVMRVNFVEACAILDRIKAENSERVASLPTHRALMQSLHGLTR